jgi:hypothetical protein
MVKRLFSHNVQLFAGLLATTSIHFAYAEPMMIDDFSSDPEMRWQYVSDRVMGGVSDGAVKYTTEDNDAYASLMGQVSTQNNGGFIQIRTGIAQVQAANAKGVYIRARGNGQRYYIHLRTTGTVLPWQFYQAGFEVTPEWQLIKLPLEYFSRSGNWLKASVVAQTIRSMGIVAYGRDHEAKIEIAEIGFY